MLNLPKFPCRIDAEKPPEIKPSYRFLVCYEAFYAGSSSNFDGIFEWDEENLDDLKDKCRQKLREGPCVHYNDFIDITLTSVIKLG